MIDRELEWLDKIQSGICPTCNNAITHAIKRSCCIHAQPCDHRLGHADKEWLLDLVNSATESK